MHTGRGESAERSIKEAAAALGLSPVAVRKRLVRGTLPGRKDEAGQWWVDLQAVDVDTIRADAASQHQPEAGQGSPEGARMDPRLLQAMHEVTENLKAEVGFLQEELRSRGEELRRKDIILAELTHHLADLKQRLPELPATTSMPEQPSRSWWERLWSGA